MRFHFFIILFSFYVAKLVAQEPITVAFTEKEGLPDVEFYDLLEDKNGFVWLAADKGLFRYDGKSFKPFHHPIQRGLSVFGLQEDASGKIWCNNISGQFFYVSKQQLHLFLDLKDELKGQLPEFVIQNNFLYVFYEKGIFEISLTNKQKKHIQIDANYTYFGAPFVFQKEIYFAVANHIKKIKSPKATEVFQFHPTSFLLQNSSFWNYNNQLFFSSWFNNKQHFYTTINGSFKALEVPEILAKSTIIRTKVIDQKIWFCTNKGVIVLEWKNQKLQLVSHYLPNITVTKILKDKHNNYWASTIGNGILVMPNIGIEKLQTKTAKPSIKTILTINDYLIYGNTKGEIGCISLSDAKEQVFSLSTAKEVTQLVLDKTSQTIFISQKDQSYFWDLQNAILYPSATFPASKGMSYNGSNLLLNASFDRASLASDPFGMFPKKNSEFLFKIPTLAKITKNISNTPLRLKRAYTCYFDANKKSKYVGFVDDLYHFDANNKASTIRYKNQSIFSNDMVQTSDGMLWVSTFANGIFGIQEQKIVVHLTLKNGLLSNQIRKLKSENTVLWIVNDGGIQAYNTITKTFQNITEVDGFVNYNIASIASYKNQLFFASNDGIYKLDKNKCFKNHTKPIAYFTYFSVKEKNIALQKRYRLSYESNDIKIGFHCNGYRSNENIQFQYRLKGHDNQWLTLDKGIDFVRYSSLPPGNFTLEVKAKNNNVLYSDPIALEIIIDSPFWQTWWFYIVLLGIISIGIWLFFKSRIARLETEKKMEIEKMQLDKELISSQLENLRSQMNPHFIFNALNSIQEYIVTNEKANASVFLVKFSRLIRMYLEHSRENEITLEEEIQALTMYLELEKDRFEDSLKYAISVAEDIAIGSIKIPSLFIQPYVENALKHGLLHKKTNRKLAITLQLNPTKTVLECIIEDNGIGRKEAGNIQLNRQHLHRSFATSANQKRVELINKIRTKKTSVTILDLEDNNGNPTGTQVKICIPL